MKMTRETRGGGVSGTIVSIVAAIALAVTFVSAGFAACATPPQTTELLSRLYAGSTDTPFSQEQLVRAAVETRDYTVAGHDRAALFSVLHDINDGADTPYAHVGDHELASAPDLYTLTDDALSHLDDVHRVIGIAGAVLVAIAVIGLASCVFLGVRFGRRRVGGVLVAAGVGTLAMFAVLALWAFVGFDGLFSSFHHLLFPGGNWTFPRDSLLITMYPIEFWMGMGAVWLATTVLLSILAIVAGTLSRRSSSRQ